jgi:hypothetical protein
MSVRGNNKGSIVKNFDSGISAISTIEIVHPAYSVLALFSGCDVIPGTDPGNPIAIRWGEPGNVEEGDEECSS